MTEREIESRHEAARMIRDRMTACAGEDWTLLKHAMEHIYASTVYVEVCANCGRPYGDHLTWDGNKCHATGVAGWFPKRLAEAITQSRQSA